MCCDVNSAVDDTESSHLPKIADEVIIDLFKQLVLIDLQIFAPWDVLYEVDRDVVAIEVDETGRLLEEETIFEECHSIRY